jgi:hypothetical protein
MPHIEFVNNVLVQNSISAISGIYADTLNAKTGIFSPDVNLLKSTSGAWDSVYTTVSTNSADWESTYTTFKNTSGTFLTSETDSQTLSYNESSKELSISNGNTVSLSSIDNNLKSLSGNWESTYTTVSGNSAGWSYDGSDLKTLSSNWQNTYTTVSDNSGNWSYDGSDIKSLSGNWESTYTTFKNTSGTFLTSETDSQTLSYNESSKELSISNGNTVSLSSINNDLSARMGLYVPLSGGAMTGKLSITAATTSFAPLNIGSSPVQPINPLSGDVWMRNNLIQYRGSSSTVNSVVATAEPNVFTVRQVIQATDNSNAALRVTQLGTGDAIRVEDETNPDATSFIIDNLGNVMLGLSSVLSGGPKITVNGGISSNNVIYASGGNSNIWNNTYAIVSANSALNWSYQGSDIKTLTSNWESTYNNVSTFSANWNSTYSAFSTNSGSYINESYVNGNFLPLSGGSLTGKLIVSASNLESKLNIGSRTTNPAPSTLSSGDVWVSNQGILSYRDGTTTRSVAVTNVSNIFNQPQTIGSSSPTTAVLNVSNTSTGQAAIFTANSLSAAVRITQTGSGNSILIEDDTNPDATPFIVDNLGNVGVGLSSMIGIPAKMAVVGVISSNSVVYASGGDSDIWNLTYTTISSNSSNWSYQGNDIKSLTGNWQNAYTTVSSNSSAWAANPQIVEATVFNADSVTLVRGNVVYSFGATGDTMSVKLASNSGEATSSKALGFVNGTIMPGGTGTVTIIGRMDNLNFGAPYVDGDALWLGNTPGTYTRTKPTAPNHGVYLGVVERANSGNGIAYVKVQNGYELYEIHDVAITTPLSGQMLRRNSANTLWVNTDDGTKWDETYSTVNTNSATNWDNNLIKSYTHTNFLPISGGTITGNLSVTGDVTYIDTNVSVTSAIVIDTSSTESALRITQRGPGDVLRVEDNSNIDSTPFIINGDGLVGVGTSTPNEQLTVAGSISSNASMYANNVSLKDLTFTGDLSTNVTSVTATDIYLKVILNNQPKYIRLFDIE